MAFWGIEVKPGKPYTHVYDTERGRLRISQATLGNGKSSNKSTVQCNVGNKSPILLCNLIPDKSETCHLDLEFEETEEVIFSVLGQRSVHLSGYYIGSCGHKLDGDETDSYGEDIAESDDSGSYYSDADEDEYESDFIDDDEMYPHSPRRKSGVVIEEIIDDEKPSNGNASRRRLKKKNQISDSDDEDDDSQGKIVVRHNKNSAVFESEDEDGFPVIFTPKQKNVVKNSEGNTSKSNDKIVDDKKRKIDEISGDGKSKSCEASQPSDTLPPSEIGQEITEKSAKKKKKDAKNEPDGTETDGKGKKKKKKSKKGKTIDEGADVSVEKTEDKAVRDKNEGATDDKVNQDPLVSGEEEKLPIHSEEVDPSVPATAQETSGKLKKKNKKKRSKDDKGADSEGGEAADVNETVAKKKKKEKKNNDKDLAATKESGGVGKSQDTRAGSKTRSYPNGLVVEELAMGKPDGKQATPGKKVSVNYIGKLKDGTIFDSNVGKRPFTFRLGIGQVIKGWDVGLKGMRVGDKRRLIVPPSYGYGEKKMGPIPANSWLTFDVELVSV